MSAREREDRLRRGLLDVIGDGPERWHIFPSAEGMVEHLAYDGIAVACQLLGERADATPKADARSIPKSPS